MITALFFSQSTAQATVVLSLCIVVGLILGRLKIGSVRLGVGGVLFSGLALGHFGFAVEHHILEFAREFGLILFVYSVGMQVGPGFLDSLKRTGLRLNLMAAFIVVMGGVTTVLCFLLFDVPLPVIVGLFSGAVTNTPALAAASQMLSDLLPTAALATDAARQAGLGYAVAYPFGIFGIILTMLVIRRVFHVDMQQETRDMERARQKQAPALHGLTVEVTREALFGRPLGSIEALRTLNLILSRVKEPQGAPHVPTPDTVLCPGMLLHGVGDSTALDCLQKLVGKEASVSLDKTNGPLECRTLCVTKKSAVGKTVDELGLVAEHGTTPTRIVRAGVEFTAKPDMPLHFGDHIRMVTDAHGIGAAREIVGDSSRELNHPHIIPVFAGILMGVLLGSIPVFIPGLPFGLKLGLAGGPLLVSIVLSRRHRVAGMICFMSPSANLMIREIGISLFLACVGINAGAGFIATLLNGSGLYWMGIGALITLIPLVAAALFGRLVLHCNYASLCGLLSGSMTDPPALAFATQMLGSDAAASVYATVYPLTMILRILVGQLLVLFLTMLY